VSDRRRFFQPFDDSTEKTCARCGLLRPLGEFVRDASKRVGRGSICRDCDREKSRAYYLEHREQVLERAAARRPPAPARSCEECGEPLPDGRRVVCSRRCAEARYRRLHPEAWAAREQRKVVRRREARRARKKSLTAEVSSGSASSDPAPVRGGA
jgi:hypothetical protein